MRGLVMLVVLAGCSKIIGIEDVTHSDGGSPVLPDVAIPASCGDGIVQAPLEECDDSNAINGDSCDDNCTFPRCGNHIIDPGEVCDDGNATDGDGCSRNCHSNETCGNNIVDRSMGEICDPPSPGTCNSDCKSSIQCGNGIIDPGEECDNGQANNADNADCRADCVINRCGDGFVNQSIAHHEDCDGAPLAPAFDRTIHPTETSTCNIDCTAARCGDGKANQHSGEACDDGNTTNGDSCENNCTLPSCGNGIRDMGEDCDDGSNNGHPGSACSTACHFVVCGNAVVEQGEECDDGVNNGSGKRCEANCRLNVCGDGDKWIGVEQCDDGNGQPRDSPTCDRDCTFSVCGDGHLNVLAGEQCDDGALNGTLGSICSSMCHLVMCGNGFVEQGEQCDDGVGGQGRDSATCDIDCTFSVCGDGHRNMVAGEQCDDGVNNGIPGGHCSSTCHVI